MKYTDIIISGLGDYNLKDINFVYIDTIQEGKKTYYSIVFHYKHIYLVF